MKILYTFVELLNEQEKVKYYIYTLSDPTDGEVKYIGKTKDLKDRMWRHMSPYSLKDSWTRKNKWLLYLKNNGLKPIIDILDEGDIDNIDYLEIYWIGQLKTWGYNLKNDTKGGQGCEYWVGKKLSDEHKMKSKMNNPLRKEVCQYEIGTDRLIKTYDSIGDASRAIHMNMAHISDCCKGKANTSGGFYWRFKDEYFPFVKTIVKQSEETKLKSKMNNPLRKDILQYNKKGELVGEYLSSHEAEEKTGVNRNHICKCCRGVQNYNSAGGFIWKYKNEN